MSCWHRLGWHAHKAGQAVMLLRSLGSIPFPRLRNECRKWGEGKNEGKFVFSHPYFLYLLLKRGKGQQLLRTSQPLCNALRKAILHNFTDCRRVGWDAEEGREVQIALFT